MSIVVLGSFMMDLAASSPRPPESGETIIGSDFYRSPGGKGANQAVAMARLGANVTMIGKVGKDLFGEEFLALMKDEHIDNKHILLDCGDHTGVGLIILDSHGDNRIVVAPGANLKYTKGNLEGHKHIIEQADLLVVQLEMDIKMIEHAIGVANSAGVPVILNPAPAQKLSQELLKKVTYLTPNETETEILTGIKVKGINEAKQAAQVFHEQGIEHIIITLGDKGALLSTPNEVKYIKGYQVEAINTVAAGDAFNGALAFGIVNGKSLIESVRLANAVGALATTKHGAIPSLPTYEKVKAFMETENLKR